MSLREINKGLCVRSDVTIGSLNIDNVKLTVIASIILFNWHIALVILLDIHIEHKQRVSHNPIYLYPPESVSYACKNVCIRT